MTPEEILAQLAAFESPNVFNPWSDFDEMDLYLSASERRTERLRAHFDCKPRYLLIGEAPGYQGCRYSGVPFTSERLIVEGMVPRITSGRFTTRPKPWSEPSATIVWGALHELGIADRTVLWNAFAWHPHKPGEPLSNRRPTDREFRASLEVSRMVRDMFPDARIVAVGKCSHYLLSSLFVRHVEVRHPANGGAKLFRQQLADIVRRDTQTGELIEETKIKEMVR